MSATKILIVEDERIVARDIQNRLTRLGYAVVGVTRFGEEAVPLAAGLRPDLVLMDVRLEGAMDGVTAAQEIRDRLQLPVVYLTAYADEETLQRARVTEPFGYVLKPFEERELRTVIEMALYKHQAERKLRASERRYAITLASIGDGVIATDEMARVGFLNPVAASLTGWAPAEAVGQPLAEVFRIIDEQTRQAAENPVAKILREGKVIGLANHTTLLARDGREIPIEDSGAPIIDDKGTVTGSVLVFHDVSERRRAEQALRQSEARFQAFMENSPAVAWMKDEHLRIVYVNRTWEQRFQRSLAEVRGLTDLDLRPAEVGERLRGHDRAVLAAGRAMSFEEVVPDPDGRPRHWQVFIFPFEGAAGKRYVGGMAVDISERKEAEARQLAYAERLEALSRRVLEAQEAERRHLARELHDEFGQLLTGLSLNLRAIRAALGAEARPGLEDSISAVTEAIRQTRNFSLDLRPSILDDFGLGPALRWYAERLGSRSGLAVELAIDLPGGRLPTHVETACFRIAQEALTNVVRHAQASHVRVEAKQCGPQFLLNIRDDGVGFTLPPVSGEAACAEGFGLLGMQDRTRLVGGQMAVESAPGRGTLVRVEIPVVPAPADEG
jgi:PAS domain S-box-containing protein